MDQNAALQEALGAVRERPAQRSTVLQFLHRLFKDKPLGASGAVLLGFFFAVAVLADVIAPYPYDRISFAEIMDPPSSAHLLGTDYLGRDLLSRLIYGARVSIFVSLAAVTGATLLSLSLGIVSGWYGGTVDALLQRLVVNTWIALPGLLVLLTLASIIGPGLFTVAFILSLGGLSESRVIRGTVFSLKTSSFVEAAQAMGASTKRIMLQHILPNCFAPAIILFTIRFGTAILAESTLSFLGYGIPPPFPTWGQMLSGESLSHFYEGPWTLVWPGIALTLAVFGSNVFGDALRDLLDPRLRGRV